MKLIESLREKAGAALNWPGYIEVKADAVLALCDAAEALIELVATNCGCSNCSDARAALARIKAAKEQI